MMGREFYHTSPEHSISSRIAATSTLFCLLAWLFSYPSKEQVEAISSPEFFKEVRSLIKTAALPFSSLEGFFPLDSPSVSNFRAEYTRLYISPPPSICLLGSRWVKKRTELSKARGEQLAVKEEYRKLGLKLRADVTEPADHLVSELDYMCYVTEAEADAWKGDDIASAREWRAIGSTFLADHLADVALGAASQIKRLSTNSLMLFNAALLELMIIGTDPSYETPQ